MTALRDVTTQRLILVESRSLLTEKDFIELAEKATSTMSALEKVAQAGQGAAHVEEISITYTAIKSSAMGPYTIDTAGNVLKDGVPLIIKGIKVTAKQVVP